MTEQDLQKAEIVNLLSFSQHSNDENGVIEDQERHKVLLDVSDSWAQAHTSPRQWVIIIMSTSPW